jgi:hypothetical protein
MADDALQQAADYRTGVGSRLLNLATGGLFGYVSGQQQREQEAEWARRQMLGEQMLRERMREMRRTDIEDRIRAQAEAQQEMLARQEAFLGKQREATKADELESLRAKLRGRGINIGEPDLETARMMAEQVGIEDEKKKASSGYQQINVPGVGTFGGTPEQMANMAKTNRLLADVLSGVVKPEEEDYSVTYSQDPLTGEPVPRVSFKKGVTPERRKAILSEVFGSANSLAAPNLAPGTPSQSSQDQPLSIPGFTIRPIKRK